MNRELDKARSRSVQQSRGPGGKTVTPADALRDVLSTLPGADSEMSRDLENIERIRAGPAAGGKRPEDMSPQELHSVLWQVLTFRDSVVKKISKTIGKMFSRYDHNGGLAHVPIEKIPGLGPLIEKIMDSIAGMLHLYILMLGFLTLLSSLRVHDVRSRYSR